MNIEPLEHRIAPAAIFVNYTDVDGDIVKVSVSKGALTMAQLDVVDGQLRTLDLSNVSFDGASVTISVKKSPLGDGLANVGRIDATGRNLGSVVVPGDLGALDAGKFSTDAFAVKSLKVRSMGRYGLATQGGAGDLESDLDGHVGAIKVAGDVKEAIVLVLGNTTGNLDSVTVGGSLLGGAVNFSGRILSQKNVGTVKIGHDVIAGGGNGSGTIVSSGTLKSVSVGGSLYGLAADSGAITATGEVGLAAIKGDMVGGPGSGSGRVFTTGKLDAIKIGDTVYGGGGQGSGEIRGDAGIGTVKIGGSVNGGGGNFSGRMVGAGISSVAVGGSFIGNVGQDSGGIVCSGALGKVTVGVDVRGGSGPGSGSIVADSASSVQVNGSLYGGSNDDTGRIGTMGTLGTVKIVHDVFGGGGNLSGFIGGFADGTSVSIGGSLVGGSHDQSGEIAFDGNIGTVKIGRDLIGGTITGAQSLDSSGAIQSGSGRIGSVLIGGSILARLDSSTGVMTSCAAIRAQNDIGTIVVKGSLAGNALGSDVALVTISARGQETVLPGATTDLAIGSLTVGGRVEYARILAGFNVNGIETAGANGNAQIGKVAVGGDWVASSITAGVQDAGTPGFGDAGDTVINNAGDAILSRIASITIKGVIIGTTATGDHFGFTAQRIGSLKAGGFTASLKTSKPDPIPDAAIELSLTTGDVTIREFA